MILLRETKEFITGLIEILKEAHAPVFVYPLKETKMPRYYPKSKAITARLFKPEGVGKLVRQINKGLANNGQAYVQSGAIVIRFRDVRRIAEPGDWIVWDAAGDVFPLSPEDFKTKYETITDNPRLTKCGETAIALLDIPADSDATKVALYMSMFRLEHFESLASLYAEIRRECYGDLTKRAEDEIRKIILAHMKEAVK